MNHPITTVIWDWNGTLLDDLQWSFETINAVLISRDLPPIPDLDTYRAVFCFPIREYYLRIGFDFNKEPFEVLSEEFFIRYFAPGRRYGLNPEARPVLSALRDAGIRQILLSASQRERLREQVEEQGIAPFFSAVLGPGDVYSDNKLEAGRRYLAAQGIDPAEAVLVGDTTYDAEVAQKLGAQCVLVATGFHGEGQLRATGRPVLQGLGELPELLREK